MSREHAVWQGISDSVCSEKALVVRSFDARALHIVVDICMRAIRRCLGLRDRSRATKGLRA